MLKLLHLTKVMVIKNSISICFFADLEHLSAARIYKKVVRIFKPNLNLNTIFLFLRGFSENFNEGKLVH